MSMLDDHKVNLDAFTDGALSQRKPDDIPMRYTTREVDSFGQPTTVTAQDLAALESAPDGFWRPAHDKACRAGKRMRDLDMKAYHRRLTFEPRNPKKVS